MDRYRSCVCYSPDDGGYYAEIIDNQGRTVRVVPKRGVYKTRASASRSGWKTARLLCESE